ncbi:MAG: winged helix-turn-helix transcriptional regulator [Abitibacteriaceae bacterium]|nr:winged helix-turn-helix transcriptional regulator [Abditibacteriaceae bacterium]
MDIVFKALADPTRRRILQLLNDREMTAGQLAENFDISAPSMSHHFNILKQADLISARREGQQIFYSLNTTVFQDVMTVMFDLFQKNPDTATIADSTAALKNDRTKGKSNP